jgi:hypothetical protein
MLPLLSIDDIGIVDLIGLHARRATTAPFLLLDSSGQGRPSGRCGRCSRTGPPKTRGGLVHRLIHIVYGLPRKFCLPSTFLPISSTPTSEAATRRTRPPRPRTAARYLFHQNERGSRERICIAICSNEMITQPGHYELRGKHDDVYFYLFYIAYPGCRIIHVLKFVSILTIDSFLFNS